VDVLDRKALNRALLARQWLLERRDVGVVEAVEHLGGLQAQDAKAPYFQLWARVEGFAPEALAEKLEAREVVRIAAMRSTIHLVSARDAPLLRALGQGEITRATDGNWALPEDVDRGAVAAAGRALVDAQPRTFAQLAELLGPRFPQADPKALAQQVRACVPLVQVPPRGLWGRSGPAAHTSLERWLGPGATPPPHEEIELEALILRYLRAFGPARAADFQKWSGRRAGVPEAFARLRDQLVAFADEDGRELLDLADAPRPPGDTPVPPRLTGPFDNLVLSHADTARVVPPEHRPRLMTQNGLIAGLVLLDGFAAGNWKVKATKRSATVTITPFTTKAYTKKDQAALTREARQLAELVAPGPQVERDVAFATPAG
jgi:hypothetical protein